MNICSWTFFPTPGNSSFRGTSILRKTCWLPIPDNSRIWGDFRALSYSRHDLSIFWSLYTRHEPPTRQIRQLPCSHWRDNFLHYRRILLRLPWVLHSGLSPKELDWLEQTQVRRNLGDLCSASRKPTTHMRPQYVYEICIIPWWNTSECVSSGHSY